MLHPARIRALAAEFAARTQDHACDRGSQGDAPCPRCLALAHGYLRHAYAMGRLDKLTEAPRARLAS